MIARLYNNRKETPTPTVCANVMTGKMEPLKQPWKRCPYWTEMSQGRYINRGKCRQPELMFPQSDFTHGSLTYDTQMILNPHYSLQTHLISAGLTILTHDDNTRR